MSKEQDRQPELEPAQPVPEIPTERGRERYGLRGGVSMLGRLFFWTAVGGAISYIGYGVTQEGALLIPYIDYLRNTEHRVWTAVGMPLGLAFGSALEARDIINKARIAN